MANPRYKFTFRAGEVDGYGKFTLVPKSGMTNEQVLSDIIASIKVSVAETAWCTPNDVTVQYTQLP